MITTFSGQWQALRRRSSGLNGTKQSIRDPQVILVIFAQISLFDGIMKSWAGGILEVTCCLKHQSGCIYHPSGCSGPITVTIKIWLT